MRFSQQVAGAVEGGDHSWLLPRSTGPGERARERMESAKEGVNDRLISKGNGRGLKEGSAIIEIHDQLLSMGRKRDSKTGGHAQKGEKETGMRIKKVVCGGASKNCQHRPDPGGAAGSRFVFARLDLGKKKDSV